MVVDAARTAIGGEKVDGRGGGVLGSTGMGRRECEYYRAFSVKLRIDLVYAQTI